MSSRPRIVTVFAILAIGAGLTFGLAHEAIAGYIGAYTFNPGTYAGKGRSHPWDGNGKVPEYYADVGTVNDNQLGLDSWYVGGTGSSGPQSGGAPYQHWIKYDNDEMARIRRASCGQNGGSADWNKLIAHERAHSRGWGHREPPASSNAAYDRTAVYYTYC